MHFSLQRARQPPTVILSVACDESWSPYGRARILEQFKNKQIKNQSRKPHVHTMLREIAAAAPPGLFLPHIFTSRDQFCQPIQLMHFPVGCCTKHRFPALLVATTAFHHFSGAQRLQVPNIPILVATTVLAATTAFHHMAGFPRLQVPNIPIVVATTAVSQGCKCQHPDFHGYNCNLSANIPISVGAHQCQAWQPSLA